MHKQDSIQLHQGLHKHPEFGKHLYGQYKSTPAQQPQTSSVTVAPTRRHLKEFVYIINIKNQ